MNPQAPIVKRGRYWVLLGREGQVLGNTRYKTKREAQTEYVHYLDRGGDRFGFEGPQPPERVPRGYRVGGSGYLQYREPRTHRTQRIIEAGKSTRFRKEE